jgi:CubicO group peptidase (beta-lactamase class C family)
MKIWNLTSILVVMLLLLCSSCHVGRYFYWNFADIHDHKKFASRPISASTTPFSFYLSAENDTLPLRRIHFKGKDLDFESFLNKSKTVAFAVIQNDTVIYKYFAKNYDEKSVVPSFSMAKSFVSLLIGKAIEEGYIKSVHDPITNYLPYLKKEEFKKITIEHLLNMRSGIRFKESYFNPFGDVAKAYYGTNLKKQCSKLKVYAEPDTEFDYISINTQLLGFIVEEATGKKLDVYLQEKLWLPLGMEHSATWSIDSKKQQNIKAFSSLNATVFDFAKLGRLMLNKGKWNGTQVINEAWIDESLSAGAEKNGRYYSYQWWLVDYWMRHNSSDSLNLTKNQELKIVQNERETITMFHERDYAYTAEGILGQFVYFCPQKNVIIVRLGSYSPQSSWEVYFNLISKNL